MAEPKTNNNAARDAGQAYPTGAGLKPYINGEETYRPYAVNEDDCEPYYTTRDEAIAYLRAMAFCGRRDVAIRSCGDDPGTSTLKTEATFFELRSQLRKNGMTDREQQLARQELLHPIQVAVWSCEPEGLQIELHDDAPGYSAHVALNGEVGIYPEIKPGFGRALRVVYAVQSLDVDDNDPQYPVLKDAIIDALLRIERRRIEREYQEEN